MKKTNTQTKSYINKTVETKELDEEHPNTKNRIVLVSERKNSSDKHINDETCKHLNSKDRT